MKIQDQFVEMMEELILQNVLLIVVMLMYSFKEDVQDITVHNFIIQYVLNLEELI